MAILLFAEHENGTVKKATLQAASLAKAMADASGDSVEAIAINGTADGLAVLGEYGVSKVHNASDSSGGVFADMKHAAIVNEAAAAVGANVVVIAQSYDGKSIAPRVAVGLDAALLSGVTSVPDAANGYAVSRTANSGKGIETIKTSKDKVVVTVKVNSYRAEATGGSAEVVDFASSNDAGAGAVGTENVRASNKISITEADTVVSGGRGMKGPENWGLIEELAGLLGAGTSCSKPVADMDWRPHHEHVGQTGIQIAPNLYIAIGISGAIQHLAGVNSSKNIVVINKDPEAPFFKIADYGIVGDLFEVVPKITDAVKKVKGGA